MIDGIHRKGRGRQGGRLLVSGRRAAALAFCVALATCAHAATLVDNFADRQLTNTSSGLIGGSNTNATFEAGEPEHGGKPGGRSVWVSWEAPGDGVATFWTDGSTFDTLLSAYYFSQPADTTLDKLKEAARNDDDPTRVPAHTSLIQFGARAGIRYEIAVDGFRGAAGDIRLQWNFIATTSPPPIVVSVPDDRAAQQGDAVTLTVGMQTSPQLQLNWRFNGEEQGTEGPILLLPSLQATNVGRYTLRITIGAVRFETTPIELQINSDGQTNALARDKLFDALGSPLVPAESGGFRAATRRPIAQGVGVSRGYNGTQIFNTTYATPDPAEPDHCGLAGGATYWYAYQPPADGTLLLDTIGSTFDTFIAVYTYNAPFTSYADLIPIACDNDGAGTNGAARLEFAAPKSRQFLVVVDGINGARGIVQLNYRLDTNRPPVAPTLMRAPSPRTVAAGTDVSLHPEIAGSAPLHFVWRKGTNLLPGSTSGALLLTNVATAHSGDYFVTVSSHVGAALDVILPLRVLISPRMQPLIQPDGSLSLAFPGVSGQRYFLEQTDALGHPWQPWTNSFPGDGSMMTLSNVFDGSAHFYRLRIE